MSSTGKMLRKVRFVEEDQEIVSYKEQIKSLKDDNFRLQFFCERRAETIDTLKRERNVAIKRARELEREVQALLLSKERF
jgi:hypothetical protein